MHMTHKKYVCCCHVCDEDAYQASGCDFNSKFSFGDTSEADTVVRWVGG
jgi:hypothetical protein